MDFKPRGRSVLRHREDALANQKPEENWKPHQLSVTTMAQQTGSHMWIDNEAELLLVVKLEYKVDETR